MSCPSPSTQVKYTNVFLYDPGGIDPKFGKMVRLRITPEFARIAKDILERRRADQRFREQLRCKGRKRWLLNAIKPSEGWFNHWSGEHSNPEDLSAVDRHKARFHPMMRKR